VLMLDAAEEAAGGNSRRGLVACTALALCVCLKALLDKPPEICMAIPLCVLCVFMCMCVCV